MMVSGNTSTSASGRGVKRLPALFASAGLASGGEVAADMRNLEAGSLEHFLGGYLHVLGHAMFVVAELVVETQRGDAPLVFHYGIKVDVIFVARQDLAECAHADERSLILANLFFEGRA